MTVYVRFTFEAGYWCGGFEKNPIQVRPLAGQQHLAEVPRVERAAVAHDPDVANLLTGDSGAADGDQEREADQREERASSCAAPDVVASD